MCIYNTHECIHMKKKTFWENVNTPSLTDMESDDYNKLQK